MSKTVKAPCFLQNFRVFYGMNVLMCIARPYQGGRENMQACPPTESQKSKLQQSA